MYFKTSGQKIELGTGSEAHVLRLSIRYGGGLPYRCAGGRCGTCKMHVEEGLENLSPVNKAQERILGDLVHQGYRLGCQTYAYGDCTVTWDAAQAKGKQYQKLKEFWEKYDETEASAALLNEKRGLG
ncbi:(2Fe-2S)-binding protein [Alicyclobacillus cycloheptanicus]|nr:(2Fe-2S)-binding protein [Alicyclobacillus cycloheptanicus]